VALTVEFVFEFGPGVMGVGVASGEFGKLSAGEEDRGELVLSAAATRNVDLLVGVAGDKALSSPISALLSPFSICLSSPPPLATTGLAPSAKSALLPLLVLPCGGGFTANSCAPGIGGGRNEEDGDGNGDELGGVSIWRERRGWFDDWEDWEAGCDVGSVGDKNVTVS
jgi:hypothetical protein